MAKAIFLHRADSIYEDEPETVYDFPRRYLRSVETTIGDWIVYFEPVKAGHRGYFAVAKVRDVIEKPGADGRFLALMEPGTYLPFDRDVPRLRTDGSPWESLLADAHGAPVRGGHQQSAVRSLPDNEFESIVNVGLPPDLESIESRRFEPEGSFDDRVEPFQRPVVERLERRPFRDVAFRRKVRAAYGERCAISDLGLRNGGGRPEVQAAHIKPVECGGNDTVRNGIALSSTLHWMFDRGLITIDPENYGILISHNKVPNEVSQRLIRPGGVLRLPEDRKSWPHPAYLQWHRENRFGAGDFTGLSTPV